MPQSALFLLKQFLLKKHSLDFCKSLVNFQSSEKVDFDKFACVFIAFLKDCIFRGPYYAISEVGIPESFFKKLF